MLNVELKKNLLAGLCPVVKWMPASSEFDDYMSLCIGWTDNAADAEAMMQGIVDSRTEIPGIGMLPFSGARTHPVRMKSETGKFADKDGRYDIIQVFIPEYQYLGNENA